MPKFLEEKLKRQYRKKGLKGERLENAVYGTMNKMGAMHGSKTTAKGMMMEAKHKKKMKPSKAMIKRMGFKK